MNIRLIKAESTKKGIKKMKKRLNKLAINKRLLTTFGIVLVMFICIVALSIIGMFSIGNHFSQFYNKSYNITNKVAELRENIQAVAKYIGYSMMEKDTTKTKEYIQEAVDKIQELREGTAYMQEHFTGDMEIINSYDNVMKAVIEDRDKVLELAKEENNEEAVAIYFNKVMPSFIKAIGYLEEIGKIASDDADSNFRNANTQKIIIAMLLLLVSLLMFAGTIWLAKYTTQSITIPIKEIEKAAKEMAQGSLDVSLQYQNQDEMGSLANSMRSLTGGIKNIIQDISRILGELSKGNFHVKSEYLDSYQRDYKPILASMRLLRDNLNSALIQINDSAQQVATGAVQMSQNAQGLAEGATEQAGAVEELTATIEDISDMAEQSAENAKAAYQQVKKSAENAEDGRNKMEELIEAMKRISSTSKKIENIIGEIEDIASQTNLLSLNASIEAARAGEAGRGFAVVADQIGKLASDSAQSAISTKNLIGKTLKEIEMGNSITIKTSTTFGDVIVDMKNFAEMAKKTSDTSVSQFEILKQVKSGIEQISSVIQSNSAAAEETSAISEELSTQAENLEAQVGKFSLIV